MDSTYCEGKCFENASGPKCQLAAKDADGDQHGDTRCVEATGDDCDDGNDKVYTGAPEVCDGLDNDCDGKGDLEEIGLTRAEVEIAQTARTTYLFPSVAYAPEANQFGIVWDDDSDGYVRVWFARVDLSGTLLAPPEVISPPISGTPNPILLPQIEWGGTEYGVTWVDTPNSAKTELFFQRRGADGNQIGSVLNLTPGESASYSAVKRAGDGRWLVLYTGTNGSASKDLYRVVVAADGQSATDAELIKAQPQFEQVPRLASASGVFGAVWSHGS
ncbi:MAG: putative metal-binding motif-containing protein, partial [Myxococcales bacterium]|nr:putative metal-binding motif-containing protein [Myxococcales bacterium]